MAEQPTGPGPERGPGGTPDDELLPLPVADDPARPGGRAWLVVAACALPVLALVGWLALRAPDPTPGDEQGEGSTPSTVTAQAAWDGKESLMLPVTAEPATGLVDGQTITVRGEGFPPNVEVGIVMCTSQAAFGGGVGWCDIMSFNSATTDAQGRFVGTHQVRRFLEAGGTRWDCTTGDVDPAAWMEQRAAGTLAPDPDHWSCIIAAGMLSDYDTSGGMPLSFAPAGEPRAPEVLDRSGCAYVGTDAGIVPTCPDMPGGPRPDCAADEYLVIEADGSGRCEAASAVPIDPPGAVPPDTAPTATTTVRIEAPSTSSAPTTAPAPPPSSAAPAAPVDPTTTVAPPGGS